MVSFSQYIKTYYRESSQYDAPNAFSPRIAGLAERVKELFTEPQRRILKNYADDGYEDFNRFLRGGKAYSKFVYRRTEPKALYKAKQYVVPPESAERMYAGAVKVMTAAIKLSVLPEEVQVYRGSSLKDLNGIPIGPRLVDRIITIDSFFSTSVVEEAALEFEKGLLWDIIIPKGMHALPITDLSKFSIEAEILLAPGAKFQIVDARESSLDSVNRGPNVKLWILTAECVGDGF